MIVARLRKFELAQEHCVTDVHIDRRPINEFEIEVALIVLNRLKRSVNVEVEVRCIVVAYTLAVFDIRLRRPVVALATTDLSRSMQLCGHSTFDHINTHNFPSKQDI